VNSGLETRHLVTITKDEQEFTGEFDVEVVRRSVPSALWAKTLKPRRKGYARVDPDEATLTGKLVGLRIRPKPAVTTTQTPEITTSTLTTDEDPLVDPVPWSTAPELNWSQPSRSELAKVFGGTSSPLFTSLP